MKNTKTSDLVKVSLFVAIIVLMAVTPFLGYIPLGFTRATIIHIPVIIGSILLGPKYGGFLGFVFGLTSLLNNTFNPTVTSFVFTPFYSLGTYSGNFWSLVIVFLPRILVGIVPYYIYRGMKKVKDNDVLALGVAGVGGSLTNTLLVMSFIYLFFGQSYAQAKNVPLSTLYGVIISVIAVNGIPEAIVAGILTIAICKVLIKYTNASTLE
ncbi:ECF transporter S component [Acetobacterium bakii]|uniref:Membrane protein n=1 Tax=Acetobacterium bakii TaxID=52689 RepID=A0A0L6U3N9_9FIRM|nr:ECF transporter S component [Acetobacterium bakii]KNZ42952.1 membrane protein [Acetobacterium bakii]